MTINENNNNNTINSAYDIFLYSQFAYKFLEIINSNKLEINIVTKHQHSF